MYHIVKRGESLWSIAQMHSVTLQELIAANPQIKDPNFIMVGEKILLPPGAGHIDVPGHTMPPRPGMPGAPGMPPRPNMPNMPAPCTADAAATEETEDITDVMHEMHEMPDCDTDKDDEDNHKHDCGCHTDDLCKRLAALPRPLIYIVRRGDTLGHIAECFKLPLPELLRVNPQIKNPDLIHPGDKIFIPRPRTVIMPPPMHPGTPNRPQPRLHNVNKETTCPHCGHKL